MTEEKARHISLIVVAIVVIVVFGLMTHVMTSDIYSGWGHVGVLTPEKIICLLIFFGIGAMIILGAFFRIAFYILSVTTCAYVGFMIFIATNIVIDSTAGIILFLLILPHVFYFGVMIKKKLSPHEESRALI